MVWWKMNPTWITIAVGAIINLVIFAYGYGRLSTRVDDLKEVESRWEVMVGGRFDRLQADVREIRSLFLKANGDTK
jgi:hypothetical protein